MIEDLGALARLQETTDAILVLQHLRWAAFVVESQREVQVKANIDAR
jgi:hypothetical protein